VALTGALLACCGCAVGGRQPGSPPVSHLAPHPIPDGGTFFEGWYLRVTAPDRLTIGAIAASWHGGAQGTRQSYVALFVQPPGGTTLEVHDAVGAVAPTVGAGGVAADPAAAAEFRWSLGEAAVVSEREISLALPDGVRFSAALGAPSPWNPADPSEGPEGGWLDSPRLDGHWFVSSTASTVTWSLLYPDGRTLTGGGLAHFEKNWGASFPRRWAWAQGVDPQTGVSFVLAGGDNPLLPWLPGGAWILGVRGPLGAWNFATGQGGQEMGVWPDGCARTIAFRAESAVGRVDLSLAAPRASFNTLKAPRADGFHPLSEMSFRADAVLRLTPRREDGDGVATTFTIPASALEFGGSWRCAGGATLTPAP
jgi:hypothetical protein